MGVFFFFSLSLAALRGEGMLQKSIPSHVPPQPRPRGRAEGDTVRKKRSPQKKEVSLPCLAAAAESAFEATEPGPPPKKKAWLRKLRAPDKRASGDGWNFADPQTGVAKGRTLGRNMRSKCRCSMCPAIHINSRSWLRSSSTHEPSDPPPKVVSFFFFVSKRSRVLLRPRKRHARRAGRVQSKNWQK